MGIVNKNSLRRLAFTALDWLYPPTCAGCGNEGSRWCQDCESSVSQITPPYCTICGFPQPQPGICPACAAHPPTCDAIRSWGAYTTSLRRALLQLKFYHNITLGEVFAEKLAGLYLSLGWQADIIVPIPMSKNRRYERGYNQVELITQPFSEIIGVACQPEKLRRIRDSRSQVHLSRAERFRNVEDAFACSTDCFDQPTCLLVDDIATTGATLENAAKALKQGGARTVYALTVARAGFMEGDDKPDVDIFVDSL